MITVKLSAAGACFGRSSAALYAKNRLTSTAKTVYFVGWVITQPQPQGAEIMSKGQDAKKEAKKKPAKSLKEKRAEKKSKKQG